MTDCIIDIINQTKYKAATKQQLLLFLCIDGELDIVKWLYQECDHSLINFDTNILLCSVLSGNPELVKFILCINPDLINMEIKAQVSENGMNLISVAFMSCLKYGMIDICDHLISIKHELDLTSNEFQIIIPVLSAAFMSALKHGYINICEMLLTIEPIIDVSLLDYRCFSSCCGEGNLEAAQWFYQKYPEVIQSPAYELGFAYATRNKHENVIKWLLML